MIIITIMITITMIYFREEIITDGCELPLRPRNGGYRTRAQVGEGQLVPFGTYLTFYCNPGFVIRPARATIVQCLKTKNWTNPSPQCLSK